MIFKPRYAWAPPYGRIDGLIYYGALVMPLGLSPIGFAVSDNKLYEWDGTNFVDSAVRRFTSSAVAPAAPNDGDWWWDTTVGVLKARLSGGWGSVFPVTVPVTGNPGTAFGGSGLLDAAGQLVLTAGVDFPNPSGGATVAFMVASDLSASGVLQVQTSGIPVGMSVTVASLLGIGDAAQTFNFIVVYV